MSFHFPFSRRTDWDLSPNAIMKVREELRAEGAPILDLTESNPTRCQFEYGNNELLKAFADPQALSYDPHSQGLLATREAIARMYVAWGFTIDPANIFLTSSTSEAYAHVFKLLLNSGEHLLLPQPSYPLFQYLADLSDVRTDYFPLEYKEGEWRVNFAEFIDLLAKDTKAVILVNPNNPTGSYIHPEDKEHVDKICAQRNIAVISDEVFWEFPLNSNIDIKKRSMLSGMKSLTFVLGGLSKTLGLPQMKLSWIILSGDEEVVKEARCRLEMIVDTFLSVNTPVQRAAITWLAQKETIQGEILKRVQSNYRFLQAQVKNLKSVRLLEAQGGWYAVLSIPTTKSEEQWVLKLLSKYHVFVHPGYFFDFPGEAFIVVSLLTPQPIFQEGIERALSRIEQEQAS